MLAVHQLTKNYTSQNGDPLCVLDKVSFEVAKGETFAIVGPSGSGKTTLLGLCAGLDHASSGSISLNGVSLDDLGEDQRAKVRNQHVGFIFQNFQLLPTLTALENVMVPLELQGNKNAKQKALFWLEKVGLANRGDHYPNQLSGGEQQRIALARAFVNEPSILFADEPTGNLDGENRKLVEELLFELNQMASTTLIIVTHDLDLAAKTHRQLHLRDGQMISLN